MNFSQKHCEMPYSQWELVIGQERTSNIGRLCMKGCFMPRRIKNPDRDVSAGFDALKPYILHDELWSPSDALARLFDNPTVRQRVGEIIARTNVKSNEEK